MAFQSNFNKPKTANEARRITEEVLKKQRDNAEKSLEDVFEKINKKINNGKYYVNVHRRYFSKSELNFLEYLGYNCEIAAYLPENDKPRYRIPHMEYILMMTITW
jgi:hypothetical protein